MAEHAHAPERLAGILLTGGRSRRMGFDKASMSIDGLPCARWAARALVAVTSPVVEVGPGSSGLTAVPDDAPGAGPLVALCTGARALHDVGYDGPVVVLACDLPLVTQRVVRMLADVPGTGSAVPVVGGWAQPLCARWSAGDLAAAAELAADGERSMRCLLDRPGVTLLDEPSWPPGVDARAFADADTPADLDRLGLGWRPGGP